MNKDIEEKIGDNNRDKNKRVFKAIVKVIKRRFKLRHLLFLALLLTMNSFAWFIYMNKISSDIDVKVKAWNISFEFNNQTMTDYVNFSVDEIYPGMEDYEQGLSVTNDGEVSAKLYYEIISVNILGTEYTTEDGSFTSDELVRKLEEEYPFKINISTDKEVINGKGGNASFLVTVTWPYESYDDSGTLTDEVDTYWGNQAYQFSREHSSESCILLKVKLSATQINE